MVSQYSLTELNELMMSSADPNVPLYWGMFTKVEPKLQGGVLIGLGVRCAAFNIPNAKAITSPITTKMAARGIRLLILLNCGQTSARQFTSLCRKAMPRATKSCWQRYLD
ncbi:MAG: hypothetical protein U0Y68_24550 [Blastocatellia bacterium]